MRGLLVLFVVVSCLLIVGIGCASVQKATDYYSACKADEACYAQMVQNGNISSAVVSTVAKSAKLEDILGQVAFNLVSGLTGVILGRKLKRC